MSYWELLLRIAVAMLLGGTIGYERDRRGRPAGLRTHMIVALASATFMVVSTHFIEHQRYPTGQKIDVDVSRIAAAIVTGIGFLGGGAIMRTGVNVQGLTTAAGLWLVGAIGMAAGAGMFVIAGSVTLLGLIALSVLRRLEDKDDHHTLRRVQIVLRDVSSPADVAARLTRIGAHVHPLRSEHDVARRTLDLRLELRVPRALGDDALTAALDGAPGLERVVVEAPEA